MRQTLIAMRKCFKNAMLARMVSVRTLSVKD